MLVDPANFQAALAIPELYIAGILAAFVSGYIAIKFMISYLSRHGLGLFAGYRIALGLIILIVGL